MSSKRAQLKRHHLIFASVCGLLFLGSVTVFAEDNSLSATNALFAIAHDIEGLKNSYPQLKAFSATNSVYLHRMEISYEFSTHHSLSQGGWSSGVPNPNKDGVWFIIDFHDPDSSLQIHRQPSYRKAHFADKAVMFLILEGTETKSIQGEVWRILYAHGVTTNRPAVH